MMGVMNYQQRNYTQVATIGDVEDIVERAFKKHDETMTNMFGLIMDKFDIFQKEITTINWRVGIHDQEIAELKEKTRRLD